MKKTIQTLKADNHYIQKCLNNDYFVKYLKTNNIELPTKDNKGFKFNSRENEIEFIASSRAWFSSRQSHIGY